MSSKPEVIALMESMGKSIKKTLKEIEESRLILCRKLTKYENELRATSSYSLNNPCYCNSGKKYKRCCLNNPSTESREARIERRQELMENIRAIKLALTYYS